MCVYLFMYPLAHKASFIPTMCNLQSDGKRNSLGKAQLDKLLSVLLFALCQQALHLYPHLMVPPVTTLGVVGQKVFFTHGQQHDPCARVASRLTWRSFPVTGFPTDCEHLRL